MSRFTGKISFPGGQLDLSGRTLVMGVINVTPDSFSDGGMYFDPARAVEHGLQLVDQGADILDVGGQSSRPGCEPTDIQEELRRTAPIIKRLARQVSVPISIDSCRPQVAQKALDAGAVIINDITAMRHSPEMLKLAAGRAVPVILMHIQGTPRTMQDNPHYQDVVKEVKDFLSTAVDRAVDAGIERHGIIIDPGIGFGKLLEHNLALLARIDQLVQSGQAVLVGTSRKRFIGQILDKSVDQRLYGTLATVGYLAGEGVHIVRVHDVQQALDAVKVVHAICQAKSS